MTDLWYCKYAIGNEELLCPPNGCAASSGCSRKKGWGLGQAPPYDYDGRVHAALKGKGTIKMEGDYRSSNKGKAPHEWIPSTLGHGEVMCENCGITNREAAAIGSLRLCDKPALEFPMKVCNQELREFGVSAIPRTCARCGLGPCIRTTVASIKSSAANDDDRRAFTLRLPPYLANKLRDIALNEPDRSLNEWIVRVLEERLNGELTEEHKEIK